MNRENEIHVLKSFMSNLFPKFLTFHFGVKDKKAWLYRYAV